MNENQIARGTACVPVRECEVQINLAVMEGAISSLDTQLSILFDRLYPVLREQPPCNPEPCDEDIEQPLVPIAHTIKTYRQEIDRLTRATIEFVDRLEI